MNQLIQSFQLLGITKDGLRQIAPVDPAVRQIGLTSEFFSNLIHQNWIGGHQLLCPAIGIIHLNTEALKDLTDQTLARSDPPRNADLQRSFHYSNTILPE